MNTPVTHLLRFRASFGILGQIQHLAPDFTPTLKLAAGESSAKVEITGIQSLTVTLTASVSEASLNLLKSTAGLTNPSDDDVPQDHAQLVGVLRSLAEAGARVLRLLKYSLGHSEIDERLLGREGPVEWAADEDWQTIKIRPQKPYVTVDFYHPLDVEGAQILQHELDRGEEPLVALRHVHRAQKETSPRSQVIEAAIAAELAIKEVLARLCPELQPLLTEVPSPPLAKLYGPILEAYTGSPSPYRTRIQQLSELRNRLLHRPESPPVTFGQATQFANDVASAVRELLTRRRV